MIFNDNDPKYLCFCGVHVKSVSMLIAIFHIVNGILCIPTVILAVFYIALGVFIIFAMSEDKQEFMYPAIIMEMIALVFSIIMLVIVIISCIFLITSVGAVGGAIESSGGSSMFLGWSTGGAVGFSIFFIAFFVLLLLLQVWIYMILQKTRRYLKDRRAALHHSPVVMVGVQPGVIIQQVAPAPSHVLVVNEQHPNHQPPPPYTNKEGGGGTAKANTGYVEPDNMLDDGSF